MDDYTDSYIPIMATLDPEGPFSGYNIATIVCPICRGEYHHIEQTRTEPGNDAYDADWPGRGDLFVMTLRGECGHTWEICIGFHKGNLGIFARGPEGAGYDTAKIARLVHKWKYRARRRWENRGGTDPLTDKQRAYIEFLQTRQPERASELIELINGYWQLSGFEEWRKADGMFVIGCLKGQFRPRWEDS